MKKIIIIILMLFIYGCGSAQSNNINWHVYEIWESGSALHPLNLDSDVQLLIELNGNIIKVNTSDNEIVVSCSDETINNFIEKGSWVRIKEIDGNMDFKRVW